MDERTVWLLIIGAFVLGVAAVILDRINFPQKRFNPKRVVVDPLAGSARDRTGSHIIDVDEVDEATDDDDPQPPDEDSDT